MSINSVIQVSMSEFLLANTNLTAEVQQKIYPAGEAPTKTQKPYITWQIIDDPHTHHQGGASGLENPRFQFDVWAISEYDAGRIFKILRLELDGFRGEMGETNKTTVRAAFLDTSREDYRPPDDGTEEGSHRASGDFLVWNVEEV